MQHERSSTSMTLTGAPPLPLKLTLKNSTFLAEWVLESYNARPGAILQKELTIETHHALTQC